MKVYLAGPVDNSDHSERTLWRRMIQTIQLDYKFIDPMVYEVDVMRGKKNINDVIEIEKKDIQGCDVLLVYPWKPSNGTAMEVMYAHMLNETERKNNKIKIVIVIEKNKYLSPWLSHHADIVLDNFHKAFEWISSYKGVTI